MRFLRTFLLGTAWLLAASVSFAEVGQEMYDKFKAEGAFYDDPELQAYIERIGERLVANSDMPKKTFTFSVLDSPDINAFATPGGFIYINRGLIAYLDSEAELKSLLGIVLQAKAILDANSLLVLLAALLMLGLIVTLDIKVREREVRTLERIGAPRGFVARLLFTEVAIVVGTGAVLSFLTARALVAGFTGGLISF